MYILVTYDVSTVDKAGQKRLNKVAKICKRYGHRVQNSVFECLLTTSDLVIFKEELKNIIDMENDSIRFYRFPKNFTNNIESMGKDNSLHLENTVLY